MIAWMVYSLVLSTLVLVGAFALEQVLRLTGKPTRWVWLSAMGISLLVPALLPLLPERVSDQPVLAVIPPSFAIQLDAVTSGPASTWTVPRLLGTGWLVLSGALVLLGVVAALRLRHARRSWRPGVVTGADVLISESTGPAVVGFLRPDIVIPDWVRDLPEPNQRMILAHERAHIRARDPLLVILSRVAPALLPWNAALWLQARRLRECVELDCDARLLADSADPKGYAELLFDVGRRTASAPMFVAALTEPRSLLERRIQRLLEPRPRKRWLRVSSWSLAAVAALLCAFSAPLPGEPVTIAELIDRPMLVVHPETELPGSVPQDTSAPRLLNPADVEEAARKFYPPLVKDAGISGTPMVWVFVDTDGAVRSKRMSQGSAHKALDEAALRVVDVMRFAPAQFRGRAVSKWIEVGVEFKANREAPVQQSSNQEREQVEYRVKPSLRDAELVARRLQGLYPPLLRDAGIGGMAIVLLFADESGTVTKAQLKQGSGHPALDEAAMRVAELATFTPALIREQRVTAWIELPVTFRTNGSVELGSTNATLTGQEEQDRRIEEQRIRRVELARAQGVDPIELAPTFTSYTVKPEMANTQEVIRMMQRVYPPLLRDAGIGGKTLIWFLIDESGNVIKTQIKQGSGHLALDDAALSVAQMARFSPALNRDQRVKVWIELPIEFRTQEPEAAPVSSSSWEA
ncbi:MAG: M56 family metallopeptidase [Gemmatimonadota bacterium]